MLIVIRNVIEVVDLIFHYNLPKLFMKASKKLKLRIKDFPDLLKQTYINWNKDGPWRLSAVVAYYAVLSLPGLLIILVNLVGGFWGEEIVRGQLTNEITSILGDDTAQLVEGMVSETLDSEKNIISTIIGIFSIIFGATGVFYQLQISLNKIWKVEVEMDNYFWLILKKRAKSLVFILVIGFLLLISFVVTAALSVLSDYLNRMLPDMVVYLANALDFLISITVVSTLFALIFKYMPDIQISWRTVWIGAILTALLFALGEHLLGIYFGKANPGSTYGAAGSVVLILLWVSYSCLIFFFGAEFTRVYALKYGMIGEEEFNEH